MSKRLILFSLLIYCVALLPILFIGYSSYLTAYGNITKETKERRQSLAYLSGVVLKERFDRIIDLGNSLATRVAFRKFIEEDNWDEAIKILESVPSDFPYLDSVSLFDPSGTAKAITPLTEERKAFLGKSFAERDYYKGVSKDWKPYISEVFKRTPVPRYNIVTIAVPIKTDEKVIGILILSIKLDTILSWSQALEVGEGGFVYFVDRSGHVAGHPEHDSSDEVVDFSSVPVVQKVLKGESGVEVTFNPIDNEERLTAYAKVPDYDWGVLVQQPTDSAFAQREAIVANIIRTYVSLFILNFVLASILAFFFRKGLSEEHTKGEALGEKRYKAVIENSWDVVVLLDQKGKINYVSPSIKNRLGYEPSEWIGKSGTDFVHPEDLERVGKDLGEILTKPGLSKTSVGRLRHKDGTYRWMESFAVNLFESPEVHALVANFHDITDKKQKEDELKRNEAQMRSIFETAGDVIFLLTVESEGKYRFKSVNNAFFDTTGIKPEMVVGKTVQEIIPESSLTMVLGKYKEAIETKKIVRWEETSQYPKGRLTGAVSVAPVFDNTGKCLFLVGSVHDITQIRARTEELEKLNKIMVGRELRMSEMKEKLNTMGNS